MASLKQLFGKEGYYEWKNYCSRTTGRDRNYTMGGTGMGVPVLKGPLYHFGVNWVEEFQAYNFALYSKHAEKVDLLLYRADDVTQPVRTVSLDYLINKSQRIWHCLIQESELNGAEYYAYRVWGPNPSHQFEWHTYDPEKILFDPYARSLFFPPNFSRQAAIQPGSNAGQAPLGVICSCKSDFDWSGDLRPAHAHDTIIYEMHVRGFTKHQSSQVSENNRGTFRGIIDKIPYLKELGVTVLELMPVFQFDPDEQKLLGIYDPELLFRAQRILSGSGMERKT